jgi:hypothetical protein
MASAAEKTVAEAASVSLPKRIDQTVLGPKGNCQSACIAMLLGLSLNEVPNFNDHADFSGAMQDFLRRRGYTILTFPISAVELRAFQKGFAIVGGMSPRGHNHAVLYKDGELWHDPHPERGGVEVGAMDVIYPLRPYEFEEGWQRYRELRAGVAEERYPGMTRTVRATDSSLGDA